MDTPYKKLMNEFGWLADLYALDYFVESHWSRLPTAWQKHFDNCIKTSQMIDQSNSAVANLVESILRDGTCYFCLSVGPFPLSLIALKRCVSLLAIRRQAVTCRRQISAMCFGRIRNTEESDELTEMTDKVPHKLRMKIKKKKEHEIGRIFDLLEVILRALSVTDIARNDWQILDVGSGIGHLSRILSLLLRIKVSTVEGNAEFMATSLKMDQQFRRTVNNNVTKVVVGNWQSPVRRLAFVNANDKLTVNKSPSILAGLHACGDLSATILRNFISDSNAKILISVGCCYHKLNGGRDKPFHDICHLSSCNDINLKGYPLSRRFNDLELSYASRELACFNLEYFFEKLRESVNAKVLFVNGYRAILEWLILGCPSLEGSPRKQSERIDISLRHCGLRGVKNAERLDFWSYVNETLRADSALRQRIMRYQENTKVAETVKELLTKEGGRILVVYALRLVIAPLIETILMEDRRVFLEQNASTANIKHIGVLPLFNFGLSPRNLVLVAIKR